MWGWITNALGGIWAKVALVAAIVGGVVLVLAQAKRAGAVEEQLREATSARAAREVSDGIEREVDRLDDAAIRQRLRDSWTRNPVRPVETDHPAGH